MNETIKQIKSHRSIRKYKSKPIEDTLLSEILQSGVRAATSGNMQFYSIVVSKDASLKEKLYQAHMKQKMILEAPVLLTFCADQHRVKSWMNSNNAEYSNDNLICLFRAMVDVCLVAQNIVLAAESSGLGTCYLGTTLMGADIISDILDLPQNVFPVTSVVLGWPDESPELVGRLPLDAIVHKEKYRRYTEDIIHEIYSEKDIEAWERLKNRKELQADISSGKISNASQIYSSLKFSSAVLNDFSKTISKLLDETWNIKFSS